MLKTFIWSDDVVTVKNGYGRNLMINQGKDEIATISAKKALEKTKTIFF